MYFYAVLVKLFLIQVVIEKNSKLLEILSFFFFLFGSGIELIAKISESSLRLSFGKVLFSSGFVFFCCFCGVLEGNEACVRGENGFCRKRS